MQTWYLAVCMVDRSTADSRSWKKLGIFDKWGAGELSAVCL